MADRLEPRELSRLWTSENQKSVNIRVVMRAAGSSWVPRALIPDTQHYVVPNAERSQECEALLLNLFCICRLDSDVGKV